MRVQYTHDIFSHQSVGGISNYFLSLLTNLEQFDVEVSLNFNLAMTQGLKDLPQFRGLVVGHQLLVRGLTWRVIYGLNQITENSRSHKCLPDIVHSTYYSNRFVLKKVPQVVTLHDMIHEDFPQFFKRSISKQKKLSIQNADAVICISNYTRERLVDWIDVDPSKIHVVHLGVERPPFIPTFRRPTGGFPYVLYIGSRDGYKNFSVLARAFALCSSEEPDLRLLTVGGGPFSAAQVLEFENLGITSKVVHLPGERDVRPLIRKAQCVVSTSIVEGFGLVPIETLNEGIPCVVSDIAVNREIWGREIPMFQPDNDVELAQMLLKLLSSDEYWETVASSGNKVASSFDLATMTSRTSTVYTKIAR